MANTTGNLGGAEPGASGEPAGDYRYSGDGSGYGPGYGEPYGGDGYRNEPSGHADPHGPDPGADQDVPVVAGTPSLRGFPGGPGLAPAAVPADAAATAALAAARETRGLGSPSVWQRAQRAWREAGVEWQRTAAGWEPAEAEWQRAPGGPSGHNRGARGQAAWPGDAGWGKLIRRLSAKAPANTPGSAIKLKGRAAKSSAVKASVASSSLASNGPACSGLASGGGVATSPAGPWHVRRGVWLVALALIVVLILVVAGFLVFDGTGGASAGSAAPPRSRSIRPRGWPVPTSVPIPGSGRLTERADRHVPGPGRGDGVHLPGTRVVQVAGARAGCPGPAGQAGGRGHRASARGGVLQQVAAQGRVIVATGYETTAAGTAAFAACSTDGGRRRHQALPSAPGGPAAAAACGQGPPVR